MSYALTTSAPRRSRAIRALPSFIDPMLALLVTPFESKEHFYELKWDGFRSLAFVEGGKVRLMGRRKTDFTPRFPELDVLKKLPKGTVLDGEIVHLTNGKPDFHALLARERSFVSARHPDAQKLARARPVQFVAFDLLYEKGKSIMRLPLIERRKRLDKLLLKHLGERLTISDGQIGNGLALFAHANKLELEGVMAKRLDSPYEPGARTGAWAKFKQRKSMPAIILGYEPNSARGIKSLVIAAEHNGEIQFAGQVGSGLGNEVSSRLLREFKSMKIDKPALPAPRLQKVIWVKPEKVCTVSYHEWTNDGRLRQPVFHGLIE